MPRPEANLTLTEDETKTWKQRLHDAQEHVDGLRKDTASYRQAFGGNFPMPFPDEEEDSQVYVNRTHRVVKQWSAAVYAHKPQVRLKAPPSMGQKERDKVDEQQAMHNLELRRVQMEEPLQAALKSAMLDGWAWLKTGFHAEFELEIEEVEEATTDAEAENHNFENYPPEMWPQDVLLGEDHEEHVARHDEVKQSLQVKLDEMGQLVQKLQMDGSPIDPVMQQEIQRLYVAIQGIEAHNKVHEKKRRERDRKGKFEANQRIRAESAWVDSPHNSNVLWDLNATGSHDWRWVAERLILPIDIAKGMFPTKDITADWDSPVPGSSKPDDRERAEGAGVSSENLPNTSPVGEEDPDALSRIWKIWDILHRRIIYLHEKEDTPVKVLAWPHTKLKTAPLRMLVLETDEDEFKPIPTVKYIWKQQLELNRYRTKMGMQARRNSRQALAHPNVPADFITEVMDGKDGAIHQPEAMTGVDDMRKMFHVIEWGGIHMDMIQAAAIADDDIQIDTGLGEIGLGGGIKAKTATAAKIKGSQVGVLIDDMLRAIKKVVVETASDLRGIMQQYYKQERYVDLFRGAEKQLVTWKGTDLLDYDIEAELGASEREEKEIERMQFIEFFKTVAGVPGINVQYLTNELARKYDIQDTEEMWIQNQQQQAQQQQLMAQGGPEGPGRGQGQRQLPDKVNGPASAAKGQPAMDIR